MSVKFIENVTIRQRFYDFLLMFYSKYFVSFIFSVEKYRDLEIPVEPIKVIESGTIRYTGYCFLLVFYSNFVPKTKLVFEIFDFKNAVTLKTGLGVRHDY